MPVSVEIGAHLARNVRIMEIMMKKNLATFCPIVFRRGGTVSTL
jgi:hypothetical protein